MSGNKEVAVIIGVFDRRERREPLLLTGERAASPRVGKQNRIRGRSRRSGNVLISADVGPGGGCWSSLVVKVIYAKCLERAAAGKHDIAGLPVHSNRRLTEAGRARLANRARKICVANSRRSRRSRTARRLRQEPGCGGIAIPI